MAKKPKKDTDPNYKVIAENRRARHEYAIEEDLECGVVLMGSEVKAMRQGGTNIAESYAAVEDGELWLVASGATGEWGMHDGELAGWNGSEWLFIAPHEGMQVFDRAAGQLRLYRGGWHSPLPPAQVNGGAAPDIELRAAFTSLVEALGEAGIFPVTQ